MMDPLHPYLEIADLIARHFRMELDDQGKAALEAWINASDGNRRLWEQLNNNARLQQQLMSMPGAAATEAAWERLQSQLPAAGAQAPAGRRLRWQYAAAAAVVLGAGIVFYMQQRPAKAPLKAPVAATAERPGITPGGNKARLILGNGRVIALGDSTEQLFTEEDGTQVRSRSSVLTYNNTYVSTAPVYNTLETPRGGEYKVVLPDGSAVWLNAASSLRFPTRFSGSARNVQLSGEAYFEVAKDKSRPFTVTANNILVTVTGTRFNIKAYPDESYINTTLVEGGVELTEKGTRNNRLVRLRPGYQGVWEREQITVREAHLEEALAWKNGLFVFRSESLSSIMRKLSRWYDVDIQCGDPQTAALRFTGTIRKYESIQSVLEMLALTKKIKFTVDGKNIAVTGNTR